MFISLLPWLISPYEKFILKRKKKLANKNILIKSEVELGAKFLLWQISRLILCNNNKHNNICDKCYECNLMKLKNHPDFYYINSKKIGIEEIKELKLKIFIKPQINQNKIIWLSNIENISEYGINSLLKILEEPPTNVWFLMYHEGSTEITKTLNSRCIKYLLKTPAEKTSLMWLKTKNNYTKYTNLTALRLNNNSPILAKKFLDSLFMKEKNNLFKILNYSINELNLMNLLPLMQKNNTIIKINWIYILLLDAIKLKNQINEYLINLDNLNLIKKLSMKYSYEKLFFSIKFWIKCKKRIIKIKGINYQLILTEQLLKWEEILDFKQ
ncbi:DNA polymerase III subunit delta' C-terminal domain-containing protein [Buchnera aphidicola (Neophyllaphis varicolor)]|uniref:DNA polymerase III subunit delta' C-terminal domain-containing protein n=1 Tax=Buchnera aphidicola TaxID=9 RepID=UPI0031B88E6C